MRILHCAVSGSIFSLFATYFVTTHHYYLPSGVEVIADFDHCPKLFLSWDSGAGFNEDEKVQFIVDIKKDKAGRRTAWAPLPQRAVKALKLEPCQDLALCSLHIVSENATVDLPFRDARTIHYRKHTIGVRRMSEANPLAVDKLIPIVGFSAGEANVDLRTLMVQGETEIGSGKELLIVRDGDTVSYEGRFASAGLTFHSSPRCGTARILIDGKEYQIIDLYWPVPILTHLNIAIDRGVKSVPMSGSHRTNNIVFESIELHTRRLHPGLIAVQLLLALLLACGAYELLGLKRRYNKPDWRSTLAHVFFHEKHWIFWAMCAVSASMFTLWLVGRWPGVTTVDGLKSWQQSITFDLDNWHPYLYALYILALRQFVDTPAAVGAFQIAAMSAMGSYLFYFAIKNGPVRFVYLVPFFLGFVSSIAVGISTIAFVKDIPFSLLVIFWAFFLYYAGYRKKRGHSIAYTFKTIVVLAFLLVWLCLMRLNGLIYLVFVPLAILHMRLMPLHRFMQFMVVFSGLFLVFESAIPRAWDIHDKTDYHYRNYTVYINPLCSLFAAARYNTDDPWGDKRIIEQWMSIEDIKKQYDPTSDCFLSEEHSKRFDGLSDADKEQMANLFKRRLRANLPLILADRTYMFLALLGYYGPGGVDDVLTMRMDYPAYGSEYYAVAHLASAPKSKVLNGFQRKLIARSLVCKGIWGVMSYHWNRLVPFVLLIAVFLLHKWLPLTALFSSVVLVQMVTLFVVSVNAEFRFVYFLYLGGLFVPPLIILELVTRSRAG
jgi:hypothetical protein